MNIITELIILADNVSATVDVPKTSIIMGKKHYKSCHLYFIIRDDISGASVIPYIIAAIVIVTEKNKKSL